MDQRGRLDIYDIDQNGFYKIVGTGSNKFPGAWRVHKINRTKVVLEDKDGRRVTAHPASLVPTDEHFETVAPSGIYLGTVVTVNGGMPDYPANKKFVVTKPNATSGNLAPLGGDPRNVYFRDVSYARLTVVAVD